MTSDLIQLSEPAVDGPSKHPATVWGASIGDYLIHRLQDFGVRDVFGIPGDYVLAFYAHAGAEPAAADRLHPRGLRRLRGRRLRPAERHRGGVRDVLRGRPERLQRDRRGLRREVARGGHQRLAGRARAVRQPAACTIG